MNRNSERRQGNHYKKGSPEKPRISIITVVYNSEAHLERAIRSVIDQIYDNMEYIIVDGGSTDGTLDIIRKYEDRIDCWVSEPDDGIYDAMNKGIGLATGELVGFLNSDDRFLPGALDEVYSAYRKHAGGNVVIAGPWKVIVNDRELGVVMTPSLKFHTLRICHQAMFVTRNTYERLGLFDLQYRYSADLDMVIRLYLNGFPFVFVEKPLVSYRMFGSSGIRFRETGKEQSRIIRSRLSFGTYLMFQIFRVKTECLIVVFGMIRRLMGPRAAEYLTGLYFGAKERWSIR